MATWRGIKSLVHDTVDVTVELVREGHVSASRSIHRVADHGGEIGSAVKGIEDVRLSATSTILDGIQLINRAVEKVMDYGLDLAIEPAQEDPSIPIEMSSKVQGSGRWFADAALGLLNVAVGDHLDTKDNALALDMRMRHLDGYLSLSRESLREQLVDATGHIAIFVHGAGTTEWSWCLGAERYYGDPKTNFGKLLAQDAKMTPLFVRYNTGRHISDNGLRLAQMLEQLLSEYPVEVQSISLFGHSMGGLVVRSACLQAERAGLSWTEHVKRIFYLGSPQKGAPLARFGHALTNTLWTIDLPATRIISKVLDGRSEGLKDLRFGALEPDQWHAESVRTHDEVPLQSAQHVFISATVTQDPNHPVGQMIGDLLVQVPSALGPAPTSTHFPIESFHHGGVLHHELQTHPAVYAQILNLITQDDVLSD